LQAFKTKTFPDYPPTCSEIQSSKHNRKLVLQ